MKDTALSTERPADNEVSSTRVAEMLDKSSYAAPSASRSRRVHSINFEPVTSEWLEVMVQLLRQAGLPKAGRSEVVRVALSELRRALGERTPSDTVKFFLDRDVEWRLSRLRPQNSEDQK